MKYSILEARHIKIRLLFILIHMSSRQRICRLLGNMTYCRAVGRSQGKGNSSALPHTLSLPSSCLSRSRNPIYRCVNATFKLRSVLYSAIPLEWSAPLWRGWTVHPPSRTCEKTRHSRGAETVISQALKAGSQKPVDRNAVLVQMVVSTAYTHERHFYILAFNPHIFFSFLNSRSRSLKRSGHTHWYKVRFNRSRVSAAVVEVIKVGALGGEHLTKDVPRLPLVPLRTHTQLVLFPHLNLIVMSKPLISRNVTL